MYSHNFLYSVADYYFRQGSVPPNLTMVFPNKRAAKFMRRYFEQRMTGLGFMPSMVSISYFIQQWAGGSQLAPQAEQIFTLYDSYRRVLTRHGRKDEIRDFDTFIFWGNIILKDFDEIDAYMADAAKVFRDLRDEKEIASNYLTEAQLEVVQELWGPIPEFDHERFWRHVGPTAEEDPDDKIKQGFLALWSILGELYDDFTATLASAPIPLATSGMQSRRACKNISELGASDFQGRRYAFIGFNVLPTSRLKIFKHLRKIGMADFFWDISSPFFTSGATAPQTYAESFNKAEKFILPHARLLPMPAGYEPPMADTPPEIEIISTPSNVGQVKVAGQILEQWHKKKLINPLNPNSAAVVLNADSLLTAMLNSIPMEITPINVTMGLSYTSTPLAAFLSGVFAMHLRKGRRSGHFFYEDVTEVLSHPFASVIAPEEAEAVRDHIRKGRLYNVPIADIHEKAPHLAFIFQEIDEAEVGQAIAYVRQVVENINRILVENAPKEDASGYERKVLDAFTSEVDTLCQYIERFGVAMLMSTFFRTLERSLSQEKLNFSGKPVEGLQIMGMADTRALDFDNVIILSMNERIFPRKSIRPTFIPEAIRLTYGLPGQDFDESISAYQFYRLISRARRVCLLYDNRTRAEISGEMSRFIYQLIYMPCGAKITRRSVDVESTPIEDRHITVHKTPEVIRELRRFRTDAESKRHFSASALKTYLKCPLQFYLKYVRGLRDEDNPEAYINAALSGTIFHEFARALFAPYKDALIDKATLTRMLASDLKGLAMRVVSAQGYGGRFDSDPSRMPGEGRVLSSVMADYMERMLRAERKIDRPYTFRDSEMGEHKVYDWNVFDDFHLNFKMSVDRVDALDADTLRFIDYKTGSDDTSSSNLSTLFSNHKKHGILQLMTYCEAYADIFGYNGKIVPKLYKITKLSTEGLPEIKIANADVADFRSFHDEFRPMLNDVIHKIFEEEDEHPFTSAKDSETCKFCFFAKMCGRNTYDN